MKKLKKGQSATPMTHSCPIGTAKRSTNWQLSAAVSSCLFMAATTRAASEPDTSNSNLQDLQEIVVTGTTAKQRSILDSSVAITSLSLEDLDLKAPRNTAEALETVPGIIVEPSGGEVLNNYTARGVPGGLQGFFQLGEDGLPASYSGNDFMEDMIIKPDLGLDHIEVVRGGTAGILTTNAGTTFVNFITRKPTDTFSGSVRLTTSTYGTARADLWVGGPLTEDWRASASAFYRQDSGLHPTGFTADHGGIAHFKLMREIDHGELGFDLKVVDDYATFYLPVPMENSANPQSLPGFNALTGNATGPDNTVLSVRTDVRDGSYQTIDQTNGSSTQSVEFGVHFDKELIPGVSVHDKARYMDYHNALSLIYNGGSGVLVTAANRLDPTQNADVQALLNGVPGAVTPAFQVVSTGQILSASNPAALNALNGNGLVTQLTVAQWNSVAKKEFVNDLSLSWDTDRNSLTAGMLLWDGHRIATPNGPASGTFISTVSGTNSQRLDIVALNNNNNVVGYLTENGFTTYGASGVDGTTDTQFDSKSFYLNDELNITDQLRIDAGVRAETLEDYTAWPNSYTEKVTGNQNPLLFIPATPPTSYNSPAYILNAWNGTFTNFSYDHTNIAATAGANYKFNDHLSIYAREASAFETDLPNNLLQTAPYIIPQHIYFSELGARVQSSSFVASLTGFFTRFPNFLTSATVVGTNTYAVFTPYKMTGVEFDLTWLPTSNFKVQLTGTGDHSELYGLSPAVASQYGLSNGLIEPRYPELFFTVKPAFILPRRWGEVYAIILHNGFRWADPGNTQPLPAYTSLEMGLELRPTDNVKVNITAQNLTNTIGLTEGSSRGGITYGSSQVFYARSIAGRNVVLSANYNF